MSSSIGFQGDPGSRGPVGPPGPPGKGLPGPKVRHLNNYVSLCLISKTGGKYTIKMCNYA